MMKAMAYRRYGGPEVLELAELPPPKTHVRLGPGTGTGHGGMAELVSTAARNLVRKPRALSFAEARQLRVRLGATYPLEHAADAQRALAAGGTHGKVVIEITKVGINQGASPLGHAGHDQLSRADG
jgi:NADPH:quinone reductase-like Zn-dependent oxidoreductase